MLVHNVVGAANSSWWFLAACNLPSDHRTAMQLLGAYVSSWPLGAIQDVRYQAGNWGQSGCRR
jgi:hypothetical protein